MDTGNFAALESQAARVRNDGMIEAFNRLGYAAVMLGERELADGYEAFTALAKKAKFPFVSANIVFEDTKKCLVQPWVTRVEKHGGVSLRVGIIGLNRYNTAFIKGTADGRNIIVSSPSEAAKRLVPELRAKVDVLVVLTSMTISQARQLARDVPGLDLVIGANGAVLSLDSDVSNGVPIVYTGNQGKYLSEVRVHWDAAAGKVQEVRRRHHYLNRDYPNDPPMHELVLATLRKENDANRAAAGMTAAPESIVVEGEAAYAGTPACMTCHEAAGTVWKASAHSHAFKTLVDQNQDFNPECVGCHVVGLGRRGGFINAKATPNLVDVQCEACHGPGRAHADAPAPGYGAAGARSCLGCHTEENSPEFDFFTYWPRIKH